MIPYSKITTDQKEIDAVTRVINSGWIAAGKETELFEKEFSNYISPKAIDFDGEHITEQYYCIFTNSCTSALKIAYKWLKHKYFLDGGQDLSKKINIYYPANTFCATYSAAAEMGLRPLLHSSMETPWIKENLKNQQITDYRVNVHYGSVKDETPCYIEDSAHRIEPNDPLIGKIRCYSFYATKNMTTAQGGMFVTNDKEIYDFARLCWKDGLTSSTYERAKGVVDYDVKIMAGGYDGNDIAAAIGRVQLKKLPEFTRRRNEIRDRYNAAFGQTWTGNHLYPYFVDNQEQVTSLRQYLTDNGIGNSYNYPNTGWLGVSLPIYPLLTDKEVDYIIEKILEWKKALTP